MLLSTAIYLGLGGLFGCILGWASVKFSVDSDPKVDEIDAILPGGQCGQCGVPGCRQAAEAMVAGELPPTCCPPGGAALATEIARMLGMTLTEDDLAVPVVAYIEESQCNGCTRCYKACPFDAIVGANRQIHTVLSQVCTGCRLCEKSCTQNCLTMLELDADSMQWQWPKPRVA